MSVLLLANVDPDTTEEEIRAFLVKYGLPEFNDIEYLDGDGSRPAARLTFDSLDSDALDKLKGRIHGMYWKGKQLSAQVLRERFS
ncbi:RNA recognition motif domain-containing protein [Cupriavidus sp. H39]|uniref:RNA recognition motif domain-containing protein n=1 Tax=Cupriavidus sp. H39 TaxID=3401635 RepID=UPI003D0468BA